jgi:molybdopterin converting factor subunit 1
MRERTGVKNINLELPTGLSVSDFKNQLIGKYPKLEQGRSAMIVAVNHEFAFDDQVIPDEAEIAIFPPVSGG